VLLCVSWLAFFYYLSRPPQLIEPHVEEGFFNRECTRTRTGVLLYLAGGLLGYLVAPTVALVIFLCLPIFYGITSHGLHELPVLVRRRRSRRRFSGN
jgi:hypothetical protein